jgi:gp32 DNA binding protein like
MVSFRDRRKDNLSNVLDSIKKLNKKFDRDERYWMPVLDKAKNGYAVIRFLPGVESETSPFIRLWQYGFQGPGGWFIEKSPTTINLPDPAFEHNSALWSKDQDTARKQKRKLYYISNIQVIEHPSRPSDEGKVFLFQYGKKIFDMIQDQISPPVDEQGKIIGKKKIVNIFDMLDGANFELMIREVEGYKNYDKSSFERPSPLSEDEAELERIFKMQYPLMPEIAPDKFKSYSELQERLNKVLGLKVKTAPVTEDDEEEDNNMPSPENNQEDDDAFFKRLSEDEELPL